MGAPGAAGGRTTAREAVAPRGALFCDRIEAGDQLRAASERDVVEQPLQRDQQAVARADQKIDVRHAPDQPGQPALHAYAPEVDHGGVAANRRQGTVVPVAERRRFRTAEHPGADHFGSVDAALLRRRGDPGQRLAVLDQRGRITDDEDVGMPRYREIGPHLHPAGAIGWRAEPFRCWRGGDAAAHRIVPAVTQQCKLGAPRVQIGVYPRRPGGPYVVPQELRRDPEEGSPEVGGPKLVRGYAMWA